MLQKIDVMTVELASKEAENKIIGSQDSLVAAIVEISQADADLSVYRDNLKITKERLEETLKIIDELNSCV